MENFDDAPVPGEMTAAPNTEDRKARYRREAAFAAAIEFAKQTSITDPDALIAMAEMFRAYVVEGVVPTAWAEISRQRGERLARARATRLGLSDAVTDVTQMAAKD